MAATFQLPANPGRGGYHEEWADYWELICLKQEGYPVNPRSIYTSVTVSDDEEEISGIDEEEDEIGDQFISFIGELQKRKNFFEKSYPFDISTNSLTYTGCTEEIHYIYLFLLLATRSNMNRYRTFNGIDGTLVFEELCQIALGRFFGQKSTNFLFGTSAPGSFKEKIEDLIRRCGIGERFESRENNPSRFKDDSIDIISFIDFHDKLESKFVAFGQCKTGVNWHDSILKLNPVAFAGNWFKSSPTLTPLKVIMLAEDISNKSIRNKIQRDNNALFFTRFRLFEYLSDSIDEKIFTKVKKWVIGRLSLPLF